VGLKEQLLIAFQAFRTFSFQYLGGLVTYWVKEVPYHCWLPETKVEKEQAEKDLKEKTSVAVE